MLYGLYLSAQGARAQSRRLEAVANNLANAGTTAFKRALAVFQHHRPYDVEHGEWTGAPGNLNDSTGGVTTASIVTDYAQGPLKQTGGRLDVALSGPGFFQVADTQGRKFLTRNGSFTLNQQGELLTADGGHRVLDVRGKPLRLSPEAGEVRIGPDGTVTQFNGTSDAVVGRLALVSPLKTTPLKKVGNSLYAAGGPTPPAANVQVKQGFLEASGTNAIEEMTRMIQASRAFETNVSMIRYQDDSLARLLQSLPRR